VFEERSFVAFRKQKAIFRYLALNNEHSRPVHIMLKLNFRRTIIETAKKINIMVWCVASDFTAASKYKLIRS
jgi:hypothetical protein